jgi:lipopolysaccharide biosynthesis glycosyltransferase
VPGCSNIQQTAAFFGSHAAYYRLLLADMIKESRFLYLDTDTVSQVDVAPLFSINMQSHAMGFVVDGKVKSALEKNFFLTLGMKDEDPMFNSGVMLVDVHEWHRQSCFARVMEFCAANPDYLMAADQTALNALFSKNCFHLDPIFNIKLSTIAKRENPDVGIFHFVGNPKPWDLFGSAVHPYYTLWEDSIQKPHLVRLVSPFSN